MNKVQNEISKISHEEHQHSLTKKAMQHNRQLEQDGRHKWVRIGTGVNNLHQLCEVDSQGNLLPKEQQRLSKIKETLGIK